MCVCVCVCVCIYIYIIHTSIYIKHTNIFSYARINGESAGGGWLMMSDCANEQAVA